MLVVIPDFCSERKRKEIGNSRTILDIDKYVRFSPSRGVQPAIVGSVGQHVCVLGVATGLGLVLEMVDKELPGVRRCFGGY